LAYASPPASFGTGSKSPDRSLIHTACARSFRRLSNVSQSLQTQTLQHSAIRTAPPELCLCSVAGSYVTGLHCLKSLACKSRQPGVPVPFYSVATRLGNEYCLLMWIAMRILCGNRRGHLEQGRCSIKRGVLLLHVCYDGVIGVLLLYTTKVESLAMKVTFMSLLTSRSHRPRPASLGDAQQPPMIQ
jgi:hypothetical protein